MINGDVRASRFVDNNSPVKYVDPGGTSFLNNITVNGNLTCTGCIDSTDVSNGTVSAADVDSTEVRIDWNTQALHSACSAYTLDTDLTRDNH